MGYVFAKLEVLLLFVKNLFNYFYWLLSNRQVAGSTPYGVIWIFQWHNPSGRTMALGSTQPVTEMSFFVFLVLQSILVVFSQPGSRP